MRYEEISDMPALVHESKELVEDVKHLERCIKMWQSLARLPHPQEPVQERKVANSSA